MRSRILLDTAGYARRAPSGPDHPWMARIGRVDRALAPAAALLVLAGLSAALWALAHQPGSGGGLAILQRAGDRFLQGELLYRAGDGPGLFRSLPGSALLFTPLALLPRRAAWLAFDLLSILALVRLMRWSAAQLLPRARLSEHLAVLLLLLPSAWALLQSGECDALLLWLMVESERQSEPRPWLSGLLWATACAVRPPFLVFGLLALAFHQGRRIGWMALGLALWLGAGAVRYGGLLQLQELRAGLHLLAAALPSAVCAPENPSAFAIACHHLADPSSGWRFKLALASLALLVMVAAIWSSGRAWQRSSPRAGRMTLVAAVFYLSSFLSPLAGLATLVAATPLFYLLASCARASPRPALRRLALAAGLAVLGCGAAGLLAGPELPLAILARREQGLVVMVAALAALIGQGWPGASPASGGGLPWRYSSARTSIRLS